MKKTIGIFSGSKVPINVIELKKDLIELSNKLDIDKYNIVYGGGEAGLMGIIPKNFSFRGGDVTGFDIQMFIENDNKGEKSTFGKQVICKNFDERQDKIVINSDIILVLPGGLGTVYELLQVLVYNDLKLWKDKKKRKVILFNFNGYFENIINFILKGIDEKLIKNSTLDYLFCSSDIDEIINKLL